jgi:methyltransferase (TIGR00027 family)
MRRAAHQVLDRPPVFEDPMALRILGSEAGELPSDMPQLRAFLAARSRYAEDELADAAARGVRQYVVLGAGLDTFACRNPYAGLRVFEVDHPSTQAWKRERLHLAGVATVESMVFVPVDFERQSLESELAAADFDSRQKAFFSWLGVTPYLTENGFSAALAFIAAMPPGSGLVFDYAAASSALSPGEQATRDRLAARAARAGEPFRLFFEPPDLALRLLGMGFGSVEDLGAEAINARYFRDRADGLRLQGSSGRLISARL